MARPEIAENLGIGAKVADELDGGTGVVRGDMCPPESLGEVHRAKPSGGDVRNARELKMCRVSATIVLVGCVVVVSSTIACATKEGPGGTELVSEASTGIDTDNVRGKGMDSSAGVSRDAAGAAFIALKPYRGRDLRKLQQEEMNEIIDLLQRLVPKRTYQGAFDYSPWYIWEVRKKAEKPFGT